MSAESVVAPNRHAVWIGVGIAVTGLLLGVVSKWSDESGPGWLAEMTTERGMWVAVLYFIGWAGPSLVSAGVHAFLFFVPFVAAYSTYAALVLRYPIGIRDAGWLLVGAVVCPPLAVLIRFAKQRGRWAALAAGVSASLILGGRPVTQMLLAVTSQLGGTPVNYVTAIAELALAIAILLSPRGLPNIALAIVSSCVLTPVLNTVPDQLQSLLRLG